MFMVNLGSIFLKSYSEVMGGPVVKQTVSFYLKHFPNLFYHRIYIYIYIFIYRCSHIAPIRICDLILLKEKWGPCHTFEKSPMDSILKGEIKRSKFYPSITVLRDRMWGNSTLFVSVKVHSSTYSGNLFVLHNFMYMDILPQLQSTIDTCVLLLFLEIKSKSNKRNFLLRCSLTALKFASIHQVDFSCQDVKSSWHGG